MKCTINKFINGWEKGYLYILFAIGLILTYVLNNRVGVLDWNKESAYLHYIKTSLTDYHTLPYFWWSKIDAISWIPPVKATSSFISIPETTLFSPLTPLLTVLNEIVYLKFYFLVQGLIGIVGVIALKKRLNWNNIQFRTYLILFLFSPIIFQHVAVGYFPWYNIFFFPWLIFCLGQARPVKKLFGIAIVLSLVLLQGGVYVFVWFVMLLVSYGFYNLILNKNYKVLLQIFGSIALVFLLANVRIYTTGLTFADFSREFFEINGYNPFNFLFYALIPTVTIQPFDLLFWTNLIWIGIPQHDAGLFWGFGVVMVTVLVVKRKNLFTEKIEDQNSINYKALLFGALTIFVFSFFSIWATVTKTIQSFIEVPFFESIKNYGYRLGIPAYLGFSIVAAYNVEGIWSILQKFTNSKQCLRLKRIIINICKVFAVLIVLATVVLITFKTQLLRTVNNTIKSSYYNTGNSWLRGKMEGISENSLDFYYQRAEGIYSTFINILLVLVVIIIVLTIITIIMKKERARIDNINNTYPFLKFELVLALPLLFSVTMWIHLATRTPYDEHPKQEVTPPVIVLRDNSFLNPELIIATPRSLIIEQSKISEAKSNKMIFPNINYSEHKNLNIATKNAIFINYNNILALSPLNGNDIVINFETRNINRALIITISSWFVLLVYYIGLKFRMYFKKKLRKI